MQELKQLHEQDLNLWLEQIAIAIKNRDFNNMDWDGLLEEIEDMGASQKRALDSYLQRLIEHILKLKYWESEQEYNYKGWRREVVNFRYQIKQILKESPSLKAYLAKMQDLCYQKAWKNVMEDYSDINFPAICPFDTDVDNILSKKYW